MTARRVAYFSLEIALRSDLPTYSGGLGVLAGDTIRSAADLGVSVVAVSLLYRRGYFAQRFDSKGWQQEAPVTWDVAALLQELPTRITVPIEGRQVHVRAWQYDVRGVGGFTVPVYFLDTDVPENAEGDRALTHSLYGGDHRYRLCQEAILGIGGVRMLRALGHDELARFHMNEGHAALLTLELLDEQARKAGRAMWNDEDAEAVRKQCVFTTHTPVPAGHDRFAAELAAAVLRRPDLDAHKELLYDDGQLNMSGLAVTFSHYVNGVAKKHGEVSRRLFTDESIEAITNGVHLATWAAPAFHELFDRYLPGWREDNFNLRHALSIPTREIWQAHQGAKAQLIQEINRRNGARFDPETFTIGFARRAAAYKRGDLFFHDLKRLTQIAQEVGRFQVVYAGKAHPADEGGKAMIQRIIQAKEQLHDDIPVVYLEEYDMALGKLVTAGCDLWLNTPLPPLEASGTSGMKAAINGVPSLSTLDGWWLEGCIEGVTGWAIGATGSEAEAGSPEERTARDAQSLYEALERVILPLFYRARGRFMDVMRYAITLNGSFFNTQRMVQQYVLEAYFR